MPKPINDQVIVITGASSGIGLATAKEAGRRGARVVLAARNERDLERAAETIRHAGGDALAVPTDVTEYAQVQALAHRAVEAYGRIDTWVNNAAVSAYALFEEQAIEDFEQVVQTNFMGQVYGAKAALPYLSETEGALICIGSAESMRGVPLQSAYSASKAALKGWLDALRVELRHEGVNVRVTLVMPSSINTPLFDKAKTQIGVKPMPLPPIFEPELAAAGILRAAEGNERNVFVGGAGKLLALSERVSPKLMDVQLLRSGFKKQKTDEPKSSNAPSNLYGPVEHDGGERGSFVARSKSRSIYQRIAAHPTASALAAAALAGTGAAVSATRNGGKTLPVLLTLGALAFAGKGILATTFEG